MAKPDATWAELHQACLPLIKLYNKTEGPASNLILSALDWLDKAKLVAKKN